MAFLNRIGNLLKQTASKHVGSEFSAPKVSLFQAIRCMSSSSKLFVGGLSYSTDDMSLKEAFSQYGEVIEARVILDRDTGRSRGFGFVTYTSTEDASSAMQAFDGQDLHGRRIRVNYATEKPRGGGGFGGGFGTGGGFNYGQGGNYGREGYQDGGYPRGDSNFVGEGGFGSSNQYPSRGGGFSNTNDYPTPTRGDSRYDHNSTHVSTNNPLDETTTSTGVVDEKVAEELVENNKNEDDDSEPNDCANNRQ